jgi:WD40 repeat protein
MFSLRGLSRIQQKVLLACLSLLLLDFNALASSASLTTRLPASEVLQKIKVIVFSANGQYAAMVRGDLFKGPGFSSNDPALANDQVEVWETGSGTLGRTFPDFGGRLRAISLSPDGQFLVTTTWEIKTDRPTKMSTHKLEDGEGFVRLWEVSTGELRWATPAFSRDIAITSFSPDGQSLAVIGSEWASPGAVKMFDVRTGAVLHQASYRGQAGGLAFSPDGKWMAATTAKGMLKVWDATALKLTATVATHRGTATSIAFSPDGHRLVSAGIDGAIKLWDAVAGTAIRSITSDTVAVNALAFSPDGRVLASGSEDGSVRL